MTNTTEFYKQLNAVYEQLLKEFNELSAPASVIVENAGDASDLEAELNKLHQQFAAARKGLGLVNKLSYGDTKLKHTKRVMTNLNQIRGALQRLEKRMAQTFNLRQA